MFSVKNVGECPAVMPQVADDGTTAFTCQQT